MTHPKGKSPERLEETYNALRELGGIAKADEVGEKLDCHYSTATRRLNDLADADEYEVEKKEVFGRRYKYEIDETNDAV